MVSFMIAVVSDTKSAPLWIPMKLIPISSFLFLGANQSTLHRSPPKSSPPVIEPQNSSISSSNSSSSINNSSSSISGNVNGGALDFNAELTQHLTLKKKKQQQQQTPPQPQPPSPPGGGAVAGGNVTEANLKTNRGPPPQPPPPPKNVNLNSKFVREYQFKPFLLYSPLLRHPSMALRPIQARCSPVPMEQRWRVHRCRGEW